MLHFTSCRTEIKRKVQAIKHYHNEFIAHIQSADLQNRWVSSEATQHLYSTCCFWRPSAPHDNMTTDIKLFITCFWCGRALAQQPELTLQDSKNDPLIQTNWFVTYRSINVKWRPMYCCSTFVWQPTMMPSVSQEMSNMFINFNTHFLLNATSFMTHAEKWSMKLL